MSNLLSTDINFDNDGMVSKDQDDGFSWSEYPVLYDDYTVGYDRPEAWTEVEKGMIRTWLIARRNNAS